MSIEGAWINEYGSLAELRHSGNTISGLYHSHTGATGVYPVIGVYGARGPADGGVPVSLAVCWHSLHDGAAHSSWSWCSALSGQMLTLGSGSRLVLHHCMVATTPAEGLCEPGVHLDKLTYEMVPAPSPPATLPEAETSTHLPTPRHVEEWRDGDWWSMRLAFTHRDGKEFCDVDGLLKTVDGELAITGFSGSSGPAGVGSQSSIALTAWDAVSGCAMAWAALFPANADRVRMIELSSGSTSTAATYVQTRIDGRSISRSYASS